MKLRQQYIGRRRVFAGVGGLLAAPAIVRAQGANGVALVIGNARYKWEATLPNVGRDAPDIARRFQAMGLKTELIQDASRDTMLAAIAKFTSTASGANLAAFYFAGHGLSWEKQTYVVPVDSDLSDPKEAQKLITVPSINAAMNGAAHRLLIFDNCRNSPADGWRQREARDLARSDADDKVTSELSTPNTLALFSTASGAVALDGPAGSNSPFAAALLRQLDAPQIDLQALPAKLRRELLLATECKQLVSDLNTYGAPFVINAPGKPSAHTGTRHDPSRIVELPNAYAFAQKNGLVLPSGLVAYRPAVNSAGVRLIGSYKHEVELGVGHSGYGSATTFRTHAICIVLSTPDNTSAEVVTAGKDYRTGTGARWRFVTAATTENRFAFPGLGGQTELEFAFRDENSGRVSTGGRGASVSVRGTTPNTVKTFTRLDG